jgi:hypothetical protein
MKQNKKALYLQKDVYETFKIFKNMTSYTNSEALMALLTKKTVPPHGKKAITDLELKKLKITSNQLLEYFEILSESTKIEFDLGFDATLKLKSIIEKIEESNK